MPVSVIVALRHEQEALKQQCVLDCNAGKKGVYYSDQTGAHYSSLLNLRYWYKKVDFGILSRTFFSKLSDNFQQVLCDMKALNDSIP